MLTDILASLAKGRRDRVAAACTALFIAVVYGLAVLTPAGQELENTVFPRPMTNGAVALVPPAGALPKDQAPAPGPPEYPTPGDHRAWDFPIVAILSSSHAAALCGLLLLAPLARKRGRLAVWGLVTLTALRQRISEVLADPTAE